MRSAVRFPKFVLLDKRLKLLSSSPIRPQKSPEIPNLDFGKHPDFYEVMYYRYLNTLGFNFALQTQTRPTIRAVILLTKYDDVRLYFP